MRKSFESEAELIATFEEWLTERENKKPKTLEWKVDIPIKPMATPRPRARYNKGLNKVETYQTTEYMNWLCEVSDWLYINDCFNDNFYKIINAPFGISASFEFYLPTKKRMKFLQSQFAKDTPDLDNLIKAIQDAIFQDIDPRDDPYNSTRNKPINQRKKVRDSRVVSYQNTAKYRTLGHPHISVKFIGLGKFNWWEDMIPIPKIRIEGEEE